MYHFYTPWNRQKIPDFLTFSGGVEMIHWREMKWVKRNTWNYNFLELLGEILEAILLYIKKTFSGDLNMEYWREMG